MVDGKPCKWNTESKKVAATSIASVEDNKGIKWTIFKNRSMTTRLLMLPPLSGRFIKKSIANSHHVILVAGIGWSFPQGAMFSTFVHWHVSHYWIYASTFFLIAGNQYLWVRWWRVRLMPRCPMWSWYSNIIYTSMGASSTTLFPLGNT